MKDGVKTDLHFLRLSPSSHLPRGLFEIPPLREHKANFPYSCTLSHLFNTINRSFVCLEAFSKDLPVNTIYLFNTFSPPTSFQLFSLHHALESRLAHDAGSHAGSPCYRLSTMSFAPSSVSDRQSSLDPFDRHEALSRLHQRHLFRSPNRESGGSNPSIQES